MQIRVLRWEKKNGADHLVPTKDVVVSPPVAKLKAGGKYKVRIVRVSKTPVAVEESYRLLVDQLPKPVKHSSSHVSILIKQSIPVFFTSSLSNRASIKWSARIEGQALVLSAANDGRRRARLSKIHLRSSAAAGGAVSVFVRIPNGPSDPMRVMANMGRSSGGSRQRRRGAPAGMNSTRPKRSRTSRTAP